MLERIAITGPESTGKSELSIKLADHFSTIFVSEYSREYLRNRGANYTIEDVLNIAKGQLNAEERVAYKANKLLFCDTDMLVAKIWCNEVFNECPEWIENKVIEHKYDLYLLCYPDLEWESDPLRENPNNREYLYEQYLKELK